MGYYVRLLTPSEKVIPFGEIATQGKSIKLKAGTETAWERIEIFEPEDNLLSKLERLPVSEGSPGQAELSKLKDSIQSCSPVSAREWLRRYLARIKTVYVFEIVTDNLTKNCWPTLGRVQNLLKDSLTGIIQADNEGFYNETGDYILWQMYESAAGTIPAATLIESGEWIAYQLRLNDAKAVELFKQGVLAPKGFLSRFLER